MKQIIAVVAILAFLPSVGFADECGCDAILLRGVFNNTSIKSNEEYKSAATDYLCSMDAGTMSGNNKTSLGIITSAFGLDFGSDTQQYNAWKNTNCTNKTNDTFRNSAYEKLESLASETIASKWENCKSRCKGLSCSAKKEGSSIVLDVYWRSSYANEGYPTVTSFDLANANCPNGYKKNDKIELSEDSIICTQTNPTDTSIFILKTDKAKCTAKVEPSPVPVVDIRKECFDNNKEEACLEEASRTIIECNKITGNLPKEMSDRLACQRTIQGCRDLYFAITEKNKICAQLGIGSQGCKESSRRMEHVKKQIKSLGLYEFNAERFF